MTAEIEAIFVSSDAPGEAARSLAEILGLADEAAGERQHAVFGAGPHLVVESPTNDHPPGAVTLWFRVPDARATYERFLRAGARSLAPPVSGGGEVVATVRTRHDLDLGLISVDADGAPDEPAVSPVDAAHEAPTQPD